MKNYRNVCFIIDEPALVGVYRSRWDYSTGLRVWRDLRETTLDQEDGSRMAQARSADESWGVCCSSDVRVPRGHLLLCDVVIKVVPVALGFWPFPRLWPFRCIVEIEKDPLNGKVLARRLVTLYGLFPKAIFRPL